MSSISCLTNLRNFAITTCYIIIPCVRTSYASYCYTLPVEVWDGDPTTAITPGSSNRQDMRLWTVESGFESLPRNCP
jgi:hypothetical protein